MNSSRNAVIDEIVKLLSIEETRIYMSVKNLERVNATQALRERMAQLNQTSELKNMIQQLKGKAQ